MRTKSESTREAILEATTALLYQREFADIGTGEIARAAGIAEGTIFRYFPSKTDIYRAIVQGKGASYYSEVLLKLQGIEDPIERLVFLSRQHLSFAVAHRELLWVLHRDATFSKGPAGEPCFEGLRGLLGHFEEIVREGIAQKIFRPEVDARACAMIHHVAIHAVLLEDRLFAGGISDEATLQKRADAHRELLLRGLLSPHGGDPR